MVSQKAKWFIFTIASVLLISFILSIVSYPPNVKYNHGSFEILALFSIAYQWLFCFLGSGLFGKRTEKYFDLAGFSCFGFLALLSAYLLGFDKLSLRQQIVFAFAELYSLRLGVFLFSRSLRVGGIDSRFIEAKKNMFTFASYWTVQALWCYVCSLCVFILNITPQAQENMNDLYVIDYIGMSIWIFGMVFQTVADEQKRLWHRDPTNRHRFIHTGLWAISRHPNCKLILKAY